MTRVLSGPLCHMNWIKNRVLIHINIWFISPLYSFDENRYSSIIKKKIFHYISLTFSMGHYIFTLESTLGATPSSHAFCLCVLMMQCMGYIVLARDLPSRHLRRVAERVYSYSFVYIKRSRSPMHHKSKQRRQKAWDDGAAPCVWAVLQAHLHVSIKWVNFDQNGPLRLSKENIL